MVTDRTWTAREVLQKFPNEVIAHVGDVEAGFTTFCTVHEPKPSAVTWAVGASAASLAHGLTGHHAAVFITEGDASYEVPVGKCVIVAKKAKLLFIRVLKMCFEQRPEPGIHPTAVISPKASIGKDVHIGPFCHIGEVTIGDHCVLEGNNRLYDNVTLGARVVLQSGAVIGAKGMSLARTEQGSLLDFPSLGQTVIEDDVEIGSNCCIDQAVMGLTLIKSGTVINDLCFIGNTVIVGAGNVFGAGVLVNGSVIIGDNNFIGSGSTIRNKVKIGSDNTVGAGAVVVKDIGDNLTVFGNPAAVRMHTSKIRL
jgi:UDP-3-O-[3-hydroxymyristoyl] glucosamine N-acyltransferase